jgi:tetratricopeptide (TPR) repeat protein
MLKALSSILLVAVATAASAGQPPTPAEASNQTIVVIGERIQEFRNRLAACLARNCPPDEDINASTALAEALFVDGEYREARTVLRASLGRNGDEAARYPEPVSELNRANARVSRHLGFDDDARNSTWRILRSLQAGIPVEDHRHFTARLEIIESLAAFGQYRQAERELRELAEVARAAGRDDIVVTAELRALWLTHVQAPTGNLAIRRLTELAASPNPRMSIGAKMVLIRIYNERRQHDRANALIAQLGTGGTRRTLLYAPPYQLAQQDDPGATAGRAASIQGSIDRPPPPPGQQGVASSLVTANLADRLTDQFDDQLIDVGFRVKSDGTVEDIQIVSRRGRSGWEQPLLRSLAGRRYSPTADGSATYRLERYSYTSERRTRDLTSSRIGNRSPRARLEFSLLSETNLPPDRPVTR